ncbi:MAG TPA: UDP-N-acetylmuramate dehydrogenase [Candidatus Pacearchaeota archaeon]|nr:UDP-N-acetylmuramate dehydrogenase [Candidatus Pacearchaeota archaeon]HPR79978.1 UDP-N-acetylmuramate dehydrogenase [Candidatus Pacearchaeota archaeon]
MDIFNELKNDFPRIEKDIPLKNYSTFRIGGSAKYFLRTSDKKELRKIIERANKENIPFLVIGGGSNILFSDSGFDGLVVAYRAENLSKENFNIEKKENGSNMIVKVDTSIPLSFLISELNNLSGLEWGVGIPGTLGGAINGNSGAFNESISNSIESVDVLNISSDGVVEKKMKNKECLFGYRTSIFKNNSSLLIVSAELSLLKDSEDEIKKRINNNLNKRIIKQPKGFSAGSIFKNYQGKLSENIIKNYPQLKSFNEKGIIPVGLLIELCNLKGKKIGDAKISDEHANFIINLKNATSNDVVSLINLIKKSVKEKFLIDLNEEIKIF